MREKYYNLCIIHISYRASLIPLYIRPIIIGKKIITGFPIMINLQLKFVCYY